MVFDSFLRFVLLDKKKKKKSPYIYAILYRCGENSMTLRNSRIHFGNPHLPRSPRPGGGIKLPSRSACGPADKQTRARTPHPTPGAAGTLFAYQLFDTLSPDPFH